MRESCNFIVLFGKSFVTEHCLILSLEHPGSKDPLPEYSEGDGSVLSTTPGKVHFDLLCNIDT